jgi:hypothetical protein
MTDHARLLHPGYAALLLKEPNDSSQRSNVTIGVTYYECRMRFTQT